MVGATGRGVSGRGALTGGILVAKMASLHQRRMEQGVARSTGARLESGGRSPSACGSRSPRLGCSRSPLVDDGPECWCSLAQQGGHLTHAQLAGHR